MSFLSAANLIIGGIGAYTAVKGIADPEKNKDIKRAQEAALQQSELERQRTEFSLGAAGAAIDPGSALYQRLIEESRQADFANLLMGHQQQAVESRRHGGRGGQSTVSDRQDEAHQRSFRALDYPGVANQRRQQARNALIAAAGAARISGVPGDLAIQQEGIGANQRAGSLGAIGDATEQIERSWEDLFGAPGPTGTLTTFGGPNAPPGGISRPAGRNDPN